LFFKKTGNLFATEYSFFRNIFRKMRKFVTKKNPPPFFSVMINKNNTANNNNKNNNIAPVIFLFHLHIQRARRRSIRPIDGPGRSIAHCCIGWSFPASIRANHSFPFPPI
jgi:hypothetical protein